MPPEVFKWLEDIRDAAAYVLSVTNTVDLASFSNDRTMRQAVERNFEIIGEALNRIGRADSATFDRLPDRQRIIAFRNILIHDYNGVDDPIVWDAVQDKLPALREAVEALLKE